MKRIWSAEELGEQWSVGPEERAKFPDKAASGRLGFVVQLMFCRRYGRFPEGRADFAPAVMAHLADQLGVSESAIAPYDWAGRTGRRHRRTITEFLGIRPFDAAAEAAFRTWLMMNVLPNEPNADELQESDCSLVRGKKSADGRAITGWTASSTRRGKVTTSATSRR